MRTELQQLLQDAMDELRQMHNHYQPKCTGGCPTVDIIERIARYITENTTEMQ